MKRSLRKKTIELKRREAESMISDLNLIVVSLDRIGSTYRRQPRQLNAETTRFLKSIKLFKRLTQMRRILSEAYNAQTSETAVLRMEEKAEKLGYWKEK